MGKSNYQEVMSKIRASDKFKDDTIKKMQAEASKLSENSITIKRKSRYKKGIIGIAACFVVVSLILMWQSRNNDLSINRVDPNSEGIKNNTEIAEDLPKLTVSNESGGMGFEGYMAYSIDELENGNPWTMDSDIKTLPVYKNLSHISKGSVYPSLNLAADEMIEKGKEIAKAMNIEINGLYTTPTKEELEAYEKKSGRKQDETPRAAIVKGEGIEIKVENYGNIRIFFEPAIELPEQYSFTHYDTSKEEANEVLDYLTKEYNYLINMKSPSKDMFGDYTFNGERTFNYTVYESYGDFTSKILGYAFNRVSFSENDDGDLWIIDIKKTDLSEKIGDYPVINSDKAKELLLQGKYISTAPDEVEEDKIAKVELVYRNSYYDKTFIPYYKFYVEIPTMEEENGLKTFEAFYVPAVEEKYIENMPVWDGRFN